MTDTAQSRVAEADPLRDEVFGHAHLTEIDARGRPLRDDLRELLAYRDLLTLLIRRDISIRYKQSAIGIAWAVVQPLMMMLIFSVIFGRFAGLPSEGIPYPLFTLAALLPWLYFVRALSSRTTVPSFIWVTACKAMPALV